VLPQLAHSVIDDVAGSQPLMQPFVLEHGPPSLQTPSIGDAGAASRVGGGACDIWLALGEPGPIVIVLCISGPLPPPLLGSFWSMPQPTAIRTSASAAPTRTVHAAVPPLPPFCRESIITSSLPRPDTSTARQATLTSNVGIAPATGNAGIRGAARG
jgi:hypothetical protein